MQILALKNEMESDEIDLKDFNEQKISENLFNFAPNHFCSRTVRFSEVSILYDEVHDLLHSFSKIRLTLWLSKVENLIILDNFLNLLKTNMQNNSLDFETHK